MLRRMIRFRRWSQLVTLSDAQFLPEQIKLMWHNCTTSTWLTILLACLMVVSLSNNSNEHRLYLWWLVTVSWRLISTWSAWRMIDLVSTYTQPRRSVAMAMLINGIDMLCWGGLAWVTLDGATLTEGVLVIAVLAGVAGNTMSTLSPVLPVFFVTAVVEMLVLTSKIFTLDDPAYNALAGAAVLYAITLMGHALNSHDAVISAIKLRFENARLIAQLQAESDIARAAQLAAEEANLAKSKFLAAASHDLRQPIHAQGLFLEVLSNHNMSPDEHDRVLTSAKAAWQASSDMLNTLLDFSRIEAGVLEPQVCAFNLQPLLYRIETEIAPQADHKRLIYRTRETRLSVESDPALVELILRNLVSNAVRYTEQGGVLIGARQRGEQVVLEVWDTGVGIPADHLDDIFLEFHQLGNPERDRQKGLGLGLAIAKGLSQALSHDLSVRSVLGRGSCFRLSLPRAKSAVSYEMRLGQLTHLRPLHLNILVVDDDELVQEAMKQLLSTWGCQCVTADSAAHAISQDWPKPPQLIVSDYRLRNQATGADAIAALRAHWGSDIPAILLTGDTAKERLREAISSGIPLLHKPVSPQQLHQQIQLQLSGSPTF